MSFRAAATARREVPMSLNIPPEVERAIRERVESGQYPSADDVLRAAMQALDWAEAEYENRLEALRRDIDEGIADLERGDVVSQEEVTAWLEARLRGAGL